MSCALVSLSSFGQAGFRYRPPRRRRYLSPNGSFPFAVTLWDAVRKQFFWGGTLVSEDFVMTAAHSVTRPVGKLLVGVGSVHLKEQTLVQVDKKFIYPNHKPPSLDHDVALLKLKKPVKLSPTVQLVNFPYTKDLENKEINKEGLGPSGNICFGGTRNKGVCFGDSGSPLLYVDDGKQYTVGIELKNNVK